TRIFEHRFYASWLDAARAESRELAHFSGERHDMTIARYRLLDQEHIELTKQRLRARLLRRRMQALRGAEGVRESPQGKGLTRLRQIVAQKRPRGSIRQIVRSVAPVLIDLKPCWMMSPMSVSQFVEESAPIFDVVVFDEASQVRPEDAICAILRGRRLIVVGDSKQLPPTQFFAKEHHDDDEDDDPEAVLEDGRRESILEECRATGMRERSLLWHYRSRHESLIAFSNHHFYDDKLITFPNPGDVHADGVRFEYVEDGLYDFGASRTNQPEAERVVDLIYEHLHRRPDLSLGIVALSAAQQDAIQNALERRRKRDPESEAFADLLDEDRPDGIFVKNLESVQGDERDVIILSVGYGRAGDGRLRLNFGPVNRTGGARRLNVAVTRAREQMILVSSLRALDIPASLASEGVQVLRSYLDYAERGIVSLHDTQPDADDTAFDSPFEEAVYDALTRKGLRLATQVGCSGYRIDLAVRDPEVAGRFLLGIECDGRSYHSSKTARDRDRLRQSHLEKMGWTILRIWSSEWRRDPDGQVERVLSRLREVREAGQTPPVRSDHAGASGQTQPSSDSATPPAARPAPPHTYQTERSSGPLAPERTPPPPPLTKPAPQTVRISGVQRAAARAAETRARSVGYAPPGVEPSLLHSVASWSKGEYVCELCAHFTPLRPGRFTCSTLQRTQAQALVGYTPCCSAWKKK
ncbi:MAG TPA: AAA domain-containing protein, partial [Ktedonobacterales bacterium]|nr:AAA domain-containing protein [Ktedonobacterales bacterium]